MNWKRNINLLDVKDVMRRRRASRSQLYLELKMDPDCPTPVKIGRRTFFVEAEVEAWLAKKVEQGRAVSLNNSNP